MTLTEAPTIENFYRFCAEKKLMGVMCTKCKKVSVPPRKLCSHCGSSNLSWTELPNKGKLVTYTVIHVSPAQFQELTPYAVGIVEFEGGVRLPGMIRDAKPEDLRIGMELLTGFETSVPSEWPRWPRYFFRKP
jgi:uncharacterized OB-fold protein